MTSLLLASHHPGGLWEILSGLRAHEAWMMLTAAACAVACAVPGCFLLLRRLSMLGDAIAHAILPGLALAFLITGSRDVLPMLIGAAAVGMLTVVLSGGLSRLANVAEDAAMGVVFTTLFALGVLLISKAAENVDLDASCVLYGVIELVPFDTVSVLGLDVPRGLPTLAIVAVVNITLAILFWKELKLTAFDAGLATTMGISAAVVHYGLMGVVAGTAVASFEAVGSVLVIAMLVAPPAAAHLLTDRLGRMVVLSVLLAIVAAVLGFVLALWLETSVAGMMAFVAAVQVAIAALCGPRHGVLAKALRLWALSRRIAREDILGTLYRAQEAATPHPQPPPAATRGLSGRLAWAGLRWRRWVRHEGGGWILTPAAMPHAERIIASHRLWESFLAESLELPPSHLHDPSERTEHFIPPEVEAELRRRFEGRTDPQGKPIP